MAAEARAHRGRAARACARVVLDERGSASPPCAAGRAPAAWQRDGRDVALLVGGPDGLDPA
jgi:23S rRNA (pseudouridine1915-N3)-methyltransferase